jgi:hypothetical protein
MEGYGVDAGGRLAVEPNRARPLSRPPSRISLRFILTSTISSLDSDGQVIEAAFSTVVRTQLAADAACQILAGPQTRVDFNHSHKE